MSVSKYLGIDLGTTNSAVAVFEGENAEIVLNGRGSVNTPSIVRVTAKSVVVGEKARKYLHADSANTFKEFKRLIGTDTVSKADSQGNTWSPEQLSAEVLKSLKSMAQEQKQCHFDKVVITVPALFELPQSKSTSNAARLAGFEKVELLPEPVASALAVGWSQAQSDEAWLVYDLGGGTFDASLLESRDGLLRVVAHDGDNFLGGRDIDAGIVSWLIEKLSTDHALDLDSDHEDYFEVKRHLESASELAKIRLSQTPSTVIELEFDYNDDDYEFDITLNQDDLTALCQPLIQRSIDICKRLLKTQGLPFDRLARVVLVGGPAHMPMIQDMVKTNLAPLAQSGDDPMSLVARGAALYAATINLACHPVDSTAVSSSGVNDQRDSKKVDQLWLQYPSVCSELNPTIMGRFIDEALSPKYVVVENVETSWTTQPIEIDDSKMFVADVNIQAAKKNSFLVKVFSANNDVLNVHYQPINIVHGLVMSDPPLSRSIGVSLADGSVRTFIERGTPLPAKRVFTQSAVETIVPGTTQKVTIPIVQGERRKARFCRKVGALTINASDLKSTLEIGSPIEITIEVDRGGDLKAQAYLPEQEKVIHGVAQLVMANPDAHSLRASWKSVDLRLTAMMQTAFKERDESRIVTLQPLTEQLQRMINDLSRIDDDVDTCQRLSRILMDIESEVEYLESLEHILLMREECETLYFDTVSLVGEFGDSTDKKVLKDCAGKLETLLQNGRLTEIERLIERLEALRHSAHQKSPEFWVDMFLYWSSFIHDAKDPKKARELVKKGNECIAKKELSALKSITNNLFNLIPESRRQTQDNYDSGIY